MKRKIKPQNPATVPVLNQLRLECDLAGSQRAWAQRHYISESYLGDVLSGRREPADRICAILGFTRTVHYERVVDYEEMPRASTLSKAGTDESSKCTECGIGRHSDELIKGLCGACVSVMI